MAVVERSGAADSSGQIRKLSRSFDYLECVFDPSLAVQGSGDSVETRARDGNALKRHDQREGRQELCRIRGGLQADDFQDCPCDYDRTVCRRFSDDHFKVVGCLKVAWIIRLQHHGEYSIQPPGQRISD